MVKGGDNHGGKSRPLFESIIGLPTRVADVLLIYTTTRLQTEVA